MSLFQSFLAIGAPIAFSTFFSVAEISLAGFLLMVMLRRVPKRTDSVTWEGYKFEVLDVDSFRIDQVMVTREPVAG